MAIIHSEDFTAASDQELSAFDSDWVKIDGTGTLQVVADDDRLECPDGSTEDNIAYIWKGPGSPTGDGSVTAPPLRWETGSRRSRR